MESQRYPINVRLIGMLHKEKHKMYMTSVLWSDKNDIIVYRSFQDFKQMHKQMKKAFPPANPLKRSDRIIPRFKDKKLKMQAGKKGASKSVLRLTFLEKYCNDLLSCDPRVTQSPDVMHFFHPKDQDLQPEFARNSIVIMPSDNALGGGGAYNRSASVGNVTQPFVTETYRCVAPYETKDTKNKPFKVALDERMDVLIKDKAGWWLVENEDKRLAWFPAPYLEKMEDGDDSDEVDGGENEDGMGVLYIAIKSYKATKGDEVSADMGSVVEVLQKSDNGWWLIRYSGKVGYIPTMYLQPYNNPHVRMAVLQQDLFNSSLNLSALHVPSTSLTGHSLELSRSQGNLLQTPGIPNQLLPADKLKSRSLNILSVSQTAQPAPASLSTPTTPGTSRPSLSTPTTPGSSRPSLSTPTTPGSSRPSLSTPTTPGSARPSLSTPTTLGSSRPSLSTPTTPGTSRSSLRTPTTPGTSRPSLRTPTTPGNSRPSLRTPTTPGNSRPSLRTLTTPDTSRPSLRTPTTPGSARLSPHTPTTPTIIVDYEEDGRRQRSLTVDSDGSLGSDSSDYSLSFSSSSDGSSLSLSHGHADECLRLSHTPPATASYRLSPSRGAEERITPSRSEPNLFRRPVSPKVPPRPQAQEILTRCTTITRKKASRAGMSPEQADILSR